jgi:uncharacterized protein with von Willebrand factor type A (vWA) domain
VVWQPRDSGTYERNEHQESADVGIRWSSVERLRELDFARYTNLELVQASRLVDRIARATPTRRSRRLRGDRNGPVFDKRQTLRSAIRTEGYPIVRLWRQRRLVPRRLAFIVDISGSMQPYARATIMFVQAAVRSGRRVEAFTFGTRLTRLTPDLGDPDWLRALDNATSRVRDWAGGTRIGESLKTLIDTWGQKGVIRAAVVVIVSDGWECGDVAGLAHQMARLRRVAHRIVWVNPLAGRQGYEPLSQGMAASLPYIDHFLAGHNLRAIEDLAVVLEAVPETRRRRH